jgi:tetratricopeptide (TPR) repeat protein
MSRTTIYKAGYLAAVLGIAAIAVLAIRAIGASSIAYFAVAAVLLIPGRIQGAFYRDLFNGRRALDVGNPAAALEHFNRFRLTLRSHPWRKSLIWLSWSVHTPSAEAMAMNNIGSAHYALAAFDSAQASWQDSIALDPSYPLPHVNLAVLSATRGDESSATESIATARRLGYSGSKLDRAVSQVQSLLAAVESQGVSR